MSLRPSGLAVSPLLRIGLVLRLLGAELVVELLEKPDLRRLGMMRTMAGAGRRGVRCWFYRVSLCGQLPTTSFQVSSVRWRSRQVLWDVWGAHIHCLPSRACRCSSCRQAAKVLPTPGQRQPTCYSATSSNPGPLSVKRGPLGDSRATEVLEPEKGRGRHPRARTRKIDPRFTYSAALSGCSQRARDQRGAGGWDWRLAAPPNKEIQRLGCPGRQLSWAAAPWIEAAWLAGLVLFRVQEF